MLAPWNHVINNIYIHVDMWYTAVKTYINIENIIYITHSNSGPGILVQWWVLRFVVLFSAIYIPSSKVPTNCRSKPRWPAIRLPTRVPADWCRTSLQQWYIRKFDTGRVHKTSTRAWAFVICILLLTLVAQGYALNCDYRGRGKWHFPWVKMYTELWH